MFNNITRREKTLGVVTISVIFAALVYNFSIEPLIKRWNGLGNEIRNKEALLRKHNRILRNKEEIERSYSDFTMYFQVEKLTPEEESAIALSSIEKLARHAQTRITNIKPLATKHFEAYNRYTFRVSLEARIGALAKFIYDLKSSAQLFKIERMVLRAKEREPQIIKAILNITKISVF